MDDTPESSVIPEKILDRLVLDLVQKNLSGAGPHPSYASQAYQVWRDRALANLARDVGLALILPPLDSRVEALDHHLRMRQIHALHDGLTFPITTKEMADILFVSPPCANYHRGPTSEELLKSIPEAKWPSLDWNTFAPVHIRNEPVDARLDAIVAMPERERPTGTGRKRIPDHAERRRELAGRAERYRAKRDPQAQT